MKKGVDMQSVKEGKDKAFAALKQFYNQDMRVSYFIILGLIIAGIIVNIFWPQLWIMWPFIFAVAVLSIVHEAAERNGQGVPPLYAYAFLFGVLALWVLIVVLLRVVVNKYVLLFAVIGLGYQCAKAWVQERERTKLIESRRAQGMCIHCGEPIAEKTAVCLNCGQEPDPLGQRMRRITSIVGGKRDTVRARATIKQESLASSASKREQALLAKRASLRGQKPKQR
jgi:hypothetical protein